jgi:hypothetical protein
MEEIRFLMLAKKLEDFSEFFEEFYELVGKWVVEKHSDNEEAYITGISGFRPNAVDYTWERRGCSRGCCGYASGDSYVMYEDLLKFIQGVK